MYSSLDTFELDAILKEVTSGHIPRDKCILLVANFSDLDEFLTVDAGSYILTSIIHSLLNMRHYITQKFVFYDS